MIKLSIDKKQNEYEVKYNLTKSIEIHALTVYFYIHGVL